METILEILGKIGFDPKTALFNVLNFLLIFLLLKKFVFAKLGAVIQERQETIKNSIESFDKAEQELENAKKKANDLLQGAKEEHDQIIEASHKEAQELAATLRENSEKELKTLMDQTHKKIEMERDSMKAELKKETIELVSIATEKILGERIDAQTDKKVISDVLKSL